MNILKKIQIVICFIWVIFQLYTACLGFLAPMQQRSLTLSFALIVVFLEFAIKEKSFIKRICWILFGILAAAANIYTAINQLQLWFRPGEYTMIEVIIGYSIVVSLLIATWKRVGKTIPILCLLSISYAIFGKVMPSVIRHSGFKLNQTICYLAFTMEGVLGIALGVVATVVVLFIIFSAILRELGGGEFFISLANSLFGRFRGGPAKVAVVASTLFGSISGSSVANVAGTGTFTIPLMKAAGYAPSFAGAVEAAASTGGQFMPPIMGSSAFIIAEILQISYGKVALSALIPALLYYLILFIQIDLESAKNGLKGIPSAQLPKFLIILRSGWKHLIVLISLFYFLFILFWSPAKSAFWAIVIEVLIYVATELFFKESKFQVAKKIVSSFTKGAEFSIDVVIICATVGIIIGIVNQTGIGLKLSAVLVMLSGGNLLALLALTMLASIVLGMGMPTVACYLILSVMAVSSLLKMGIPPLVAHMFIFYFGIMANITPPVALASYAGAAIAGASFTKTGLNAVRLGIVGFIIPYLFIFYPELLLVGENLTRLPFTILLMVTILLALSIGMGGYLFRKLNILDRIFFFVASFLLVQSNILIRFTGLILLCAVSVYNYYKGKLHLEK